jgi:molecular chaperone GrpE
MSEQENGGAGRRPAEAPEDTSAGSAAEVVEAEGMEPAEAPGGDGAHAGGSPELDALRERHLRLAAEFDNYRKRMERERSESWLRAQAQLLERILEPLDDLERIARQDPEATSAAALQEGAAMVERKFMRVLEAAGVEAIEAEGKPFDPTIHEALTTVPAASEDEDETVAQVYQKGYRLKGVLVRAARVVVRKHGG